MVYTNDFQELLKEIKLYNQLDLVSQGLQTKYAKEMSGEDDEARRKDALKTNDLLEKILVALTGGKQKANDSEPEKKFSLKEDFAKFKTELQDSLSFVKKGIIGAATLNEKVYTKVGGALSSDNPNIRDSPAELLADETEKQTQTIDNLLSTTSESLTTLKKIGFILKGSSEQIKLNEEENKTSKEVLSELKKLNEVTAENVAAGGSGGGVGLDIGLGGKGKVDVPAGADKKAGGKAAAKGVGKSLLKKIPVVGAVAGLAFGASRLMQGDTAGAAMEVASGVAGTIPGVGTAASVGIDAALAAKDAGVLDKKEEPASKVGGAIAASAKGGSSAKGEENLEKLQMAQGELQGIYKDYRDEKAKVSEKLAGDRKNYPEGFIDDPSDPEYPKELKAIDDKYKKIIDAKKKEIEQLGKAPGIKEAKAKQAKEDSNFFGDDKEVAPAKTKSKVTGESVKTTSTQTVTGGGSETTKMVLSEDAKKAEAEGPAMSKRHQAEYSELRGKLETEGKLEGKSRREIMNMPEIKELRARQDAEQDARGKRVTDGMTYEVSKTSGENAAMRDEIAGAKGGQTAVMNNVSNNTQTTYMPIKGEPRPGSRGSALDNYNNRVASY